MNLRLLFLALATLASPSLWPECGSAQSVDSGRAASTEFAAPAPVPPAPVPPFVPFSGKLPAHDGNAAPRQASIAFLIFKEAQGGDPLWMETQIVPVEASGHFSAHLGAARPDGLPTDLFASGEARWLEVQAAGEPPQPRVLLASVPYALKASDAATLGGLPASAFALARPAEAAPATLDAPALTVPTATPVTATGGSAGYLAQFSGAYTIVDSPIYSTFTGVGINTTIPNGELDVAGTTILEGATTLPKLATANSTGPANSAPLVFTASSFNSLSRTAVTPTFLWQAEGTGNGTLSASGTFNLLASLGTRVAETGFNINTQGILHFAPGQTFPGAGSITGVTAGTGLTGGGTAGAVTISLDTTKVPTLSGANVFTGSETVSGSVIAFGDLFGEELNLPKTANAAAGLINIGGVPALHTFGSANVFLGDAGNFNLTGANSTGTGHLALHALTTGINDTATGYGALVDNTTGSYNTAAGMYALFSDTTGQDNTAIGAYSGLLSGFPSLDNATAVGANALVGQNNSLVLGNTTGTSGAEFVNVGIGTPFPRSVLEASVTAPGKLGPALTLSNLAGTANTAAAIDFNTASPTRGTYNPTARIEAVDDGTFGNSLVFLSNIDSAYDNGMQANLTIGSNGQLTIGPVTPQDVLYGGQINIHPSSHAGLVAYGGIGGSATPFAAPGIIGTGADGPASAGGVGGTDGADGGDFEGGKPYGLGSGGDGITATAGGVNNLTNGALAGNFQGDVAATGTIIASQNAVQMDHPLDPANKYLIQSTVASSERINIYSGNAMTDDLGIAIVHLPDWFEAENGDFRYQLTVLGGRFAQAVVSSEIHDRQFTISTNATQVKVSWQVTGVRQDAWAKAHPLIAEQPKSDRERGYYLHPELYGQPEEKQTEWARHPQAMRRRKALQQAQSHQPRSPARSGPATALSGPPASAADRQFAPAPASVQPAQPAQPAPAAGPKS